MFYVEISLPLVGLIFDFVFYDYFLEDKDVKIFILGKRYLVLFYTFFFMFTSRLN